MIPKVCSDSYSLFGRVEVLGIGFKELKDLLALGNVGGKFQQSLWERRERRRHKHTVKRLHVLFKRAGLNVNE